MNVEFDTLPRGVQQEIASILFESVPELAGHWSWEYVLQELTDLVDPVVLPRRRMQIRELSDFKCGRASSVAVKQYVHLLRSGSQPPPILIAGTQLLDGNHRCEALLAAGQLSADAVDIGQLLHMNWSAWLEGNIPADAPVRSRLHRSAKKTSHGNE